MIVQTFPSGPFQTNAYVVGCSETRDCAIVDPGPESAVKIQQFIEEEGVAPKLLLLTHTHWDHTVDAAKIKNRYSIPAFVHREDAKNLTDPGSDGLPMLYSIEPVQPDHFLKEGEKVVVGKLSFEVIHTPGHTPGGVCFYDREHHFLLSGDTLFQGSIGNLSFPTAEPERMWKSLEKLANLPKQTRVFPGHGPMTTIGDEPWLPDAKNIFS